MKTRLIVRDYKGDALERVLVEVANGLVYVANPDLVEAVNCGDSYPVGFPIEDAYLFDKTWLLSIRTKRGRVNQISKDDWGRLRPYGEGAAIRFGTQHFAGTCKMKEAAN
jgi:hypothetical protein